MDIKRVTAKDLFSYEDLDLPLSDRGLVLVEGENGAGKSSIFQVVTWVLYGDSLKKERADDVIRTVPKGVYPKITHEPVVGSTFGRVGMEINGQEVVIERYRQHKQHKNKVYLFIDHNDVTGASDKETQLRINELMGMDLQVFVNSVLYPQKSDGFASGSDSEQKKILDSLLNTERFAIAQKRVKAQLDELTPTVTRLEQEINTLEVRVKDTETRLETHRRQDEEYEIRRQTQIVQAQERVERLKSQKPQVDESLDVLVKELQQAVDQGAEARTLAAQAEKAISGLRSQIASLQAKISLQRRALSDVPETEPQKPEFPSSKFAQELTETQSQISRLTGEIGMLRKTVTNLEQKVQKKEHTTHCDRCGQVLPSDAKDRLYGSYDQELEISRLELTSKEKHLQALQGLVVSSQRSYEMAVCWEAWDDGQEIRKEIQAAEQQVTDLASQTDSYQQIVQGTREMVQEATDAQAKLLSTQRQIDAQRASCAMWERDLQTAERDLANIMSQTSPYTSMVVREQENLRILLSSLTWNTRLITHFRKEVAHLTWLEAAFGNKGVKNLCYERAIPFLTRRTNEYLYDLSNGNAYAEFHTQDTLANGNTVERFHVDVRYTNGGGRYTALSGGEEARVNISVMFALGDLGASRATNPIRLRLLDEPFDGLDALGKELVVQVLKEKLLDRAGTILVMSHDDSLKQLFENRISVVKENGVSRLAA